MDNALGSDSEMRKDKTGFTLHIPCCKTTHKLFETSIKISRSSSDHLVVVKK